MQEKSNTRSFILPSGARITIDDPDGRLKDCFQQLFGSTVAGSAVIANQVIKHNKQYGFER